MQKILLLTSLFIYGSNILLSQSDLLILYITFKKDPVVLNYKNTVSIIDSLTRIKQFSHPKSSVQLIRKMITLGEENNGRFCERYLDVNPVDLQDNERNICLVCKHDVLHSKVREKYKVLYESSEYYQKITTYIYNR